METTTVYTLAFKGTLLELAEEKAAEFPPEIVKAWPFEHNAYTGDAAIGVGVKLADNRLGPAFGTDAETLAVAKGKYIAEEIGVSPASPGNLPPVVLKQFARVIERGIYPTEKEIEALKIPLGGKSASSTEQAD